MTRKAIKLRHQFPENYDTNAAGDETAIETGAHGADQSFKDDCDINVILKRFGIGYEIPAGVRMPQPGDFVGISDFHTAMNQLRETQENFNALPANIRAEFNNDPGQFFAAALDEKNRDRFAELGMLTQKATERAKIAADERQRKADAEAAQRHAERLKSALQGADTQPAPQK